jgi:hypothetical protein
MSELDKKNLPHDRSLKVVTDADFCSYQVALQAARKEKNAISAGGDGSSSEPRHELEVVKEEGLVKKIKVVCKCGEVIEIDCSYEDK